MSVVGEYERILGDFLAALKASQTEFATHFAKRLANAEISRAGNVSRAAERALELLSEVAGDKVTGFPGPLERDRFREERERFLAICRIVLGCS